MTVMTATTKIPDDLATIVVMTEREAVLRNLLITQRYHDLSIGLRETVCSSNVNWSTFATWASKTAGESIRGEEVPKAIRGLLDEARAVLDRLNYINEALRFLGAGREVDVTRLLSPITRTLADVSSQISQGNLKVFAELAPVFARFIAAFRGTTTADPAALETFLGTLIPGPVEDGGQALLRTAFTAYYTAKFEPDGAIRARWILLGNALIGLHEQSRLQPQIEGALDAPIRDTFETALDDLTRELVPFGRHLGIDDAIQEHTKPLVDEIQLVFRRLATRHMMTLALPDGERLVLGVDVPPEHKTRVFPATLQDLPSPKELLEIIERYDRAKNGLAGSASIDWANLPDRMNFIFNLFRSRQQDLELFEPPFSMTQQASVAAGKVPNGPL